MAVLWVNVTSLLEISYRKKVGLWADRRGSRKKMMSFLSSIAEKRLEEWTLGYQQVIHNTKLPTAAIVQVAATPTYDTKETLGLYKCL